MLALCLATKESYFIFNGLLYKQIDGAAMGAPFGSFLANAFLSYHKKYWLNNCLWGFRPVFYGRYVDDVFITVSICTVAVNYTSKYYVHGSLFSLKKLPCTVFWNAVCTAECFSLKKLPCTVLWNATCTAVCFSLKKLPHTIFWNTICTAVQILLKVLPCTKSWNALIFSKTDIVGCILE